MSLMRGLKREWARVPRSVRRYCVICGRRVGRFLPYRGVVRRPVLMCELSVVGSDTRNFECPHCGAHDRERHLFLYLQVSGLAEKMSGMRILHFAPERQLTRHIGASAPCSYVKCDLFPAEGSMLRADIECMPFTDSSFDLVIANHVMEHVEDDLRALREVRRVLAPGGNAILQTPYSAVLRSTWSDPGITTDTARLQAYGQADHVRLFGLDIFERFSSVGLVACTETHSSVLGAYDPIEYGVNPAEPFFLFRRPD